MTKIALTILCYILARSALLTWAMVCTTLFYIGLRGRHREYRDSIHDSSQQFTNFLLESLSCKTIFIPNIPYFAHNNIPLLLDTINTLWNRLPQNQLLIFKMSLDGEATDILWKFQRHKLYNYGSWAKFWTPQHSLKTVWKQYKTQILKFVVKRFFRHFFFQNNPTFCCTF